MNIRSLFSKSKIEITVVKKNENGLIFHVKDGKGLLINKYGPVDGKGLYALTFDDIPLIKFHGDEYFCPTCEKLVSAGYGLDMSDNKTIFEMSDVLNEPFVNLEKSLNDLKPLLGLLSTGYYILSEKDIFPTDGCGKFFWSIGNTPSVNRATVPVYDGLSFNWNSPTPKYALPTQSPKLFNPERVAHYMAHDNNSRAIAYALEGYLCALIDGHHKACAATLQGKALKTLVIEPPIGLSYPNKTTGAKWGLCFPGFTLYEDEIHESFESVQKSFSTGSLLTKEETLKYLSMINDECDNFLCPADLLDASKIYYDVFTHACIEWAGDLSDERLTRIIDGKENPDESILNYIVNALYATANPRFTEFAIYIGKNENYAGIWFEIFSLLSKIKSKEIEDFFIDFLICDYNLRPYLTKIADDYLSVV